MNASNAKDYLPLVLALAEGKVIQEYFAIEEVWRDMAELRFDAAASQYRIKPEPKDFFMNRYEDGTEDGPFDTTFHASINLRLNGRIVRYREVIE